MSNPLQNITSIAPMANAADSPKSPSGAQADYEDGKRFLEKNELSQAAVAFHNALLAYEEKGDEKGIANACHQLGHVCLARQEFGQAEKHYLRARQLCEKFADPASLAALSKKMVEVYRGLERYDMAVASCLELVDGYMANNDPRGTVAILEILAEVYIDAAKPAQAADAYRTIASIHRNYKHASIADSYEKKAAELAGNI